MQRKLSFSAPVRIGTVDRGSASGHAFVLNITGHKNYHLEDERVVLVLPNPELQR